MNPIDIEQKVASHYSSGRVTVRILAALGLEGAKPGSVPVEQLFAVDQLHHGGLGLTEKMAKLSGVSQGLSVLDAGSGIGGSARFLAHRFDCAVEAIDLSAEFVETAKGLDQLVGLKNRVTHRVGSVTDLPYAAKAFDMVWSQNVTMNVPDKQAMFAEAYRVLRPGGVYVLTHIGAVDDRPIKYPLPWAMSAETSFATSPAELLRMLEAAGFRDIVDHAKGVPPAPPPAAVEGAPDDAAAMGDDMPERRKNSGLAVAAGHLVPMLMTARR